MTKNRLYILFFIIAVPCYGLAQSEHRDTLRLNFEECISFALNNNYNKQSMLLNEDARENTLKQSKLERLPNLNASFGETFSHSQQTGSQWNGNYSLSTGITLYKGGTINKTIQRNQLSLEQSQLQTAQYDNDLMIQVIQAILTIWGNEELIKYQDALITASEEQVRQGKLQLEAGEILNSDFLLLEAQLVIDKNNFAESIINRNIQLNTLKTLLSIDPKQPVVIAMPDQSSIDQSIELPAEDYVLNRSLETLPDLHIYDYNINLAELDLKLSKTSYIPSLSLNASVGTGHTDNFNQYGSQLSNKFNEQVGLSVTVPIFNRNQVKSNVQQSQIALRQAEMNRSQAEISLKDNIIQNYNNVMSAANSFQTSQTKMEAYNASYNSYKLLFEAGTITAVDLLQQQNNYISAMTEYIRNKYTFLLRRKILDVYMGETVKM
ncbi:TolC family protein [Bacteroidales bacterium OttesenSCG-928-B11]|nr:TolC family protein [Bacteroidales bacterium OttesenSCG-928-C03]MDL2312929.1 TolC family protein [Bacteroidales bacterium OttesenSCG-928-B11]MDL2325541.1 TolC family protein [Bacteroidales bacterium OttesenSCG-928-A14]